MISRAYAARSEHDPDRQFALVVMARRNRAEVMALSDDGRDRAFAEDELEIQHQFYMAQARS